MAAITHAHSGVMPNRPHDYIYDSTFTVSSHKDHVKQMTRSQAQQVIINPTFNNMFSALRHYPPMQYRLKINPFPSGIGQDRRTVIGSESVSGQNRFKYFKRPIMPYQPVFSGQIIYARQAAEHLSMSIDQQLQQPTNQKIESHGSYLGKESKTIAIQTMYRISETQTDPYSPDYVFKPNEPPPELLALSTLSYGQGLPAGVAELDMIERARVKRLWESTLPIVTDQVSFERRLKMMEEMELKEWEERELEIKKLQEARLVVLESVIRQREKENEEENDKRVERIWQKKMQEREAVFDKINRKRIKALRKLADRRSKIDQKVEKRDIISEYGNYASKVYAPKAREGVFRDKADTTLHIRLDELTHYAGLQNLEASLPPSVMEIKVDESLKVSTNHDHSPEARREKVLKDQLEKMNSKLVERKEKQNQVKPPLKYAVKIEKPPARPPTPTIYIPSEEEEEMETAAFLLQNLIRGRAVQLDMYKQKERRLNLIQELRTRHILRTLSTPTTTTSTHPQNSSLESISNDTGTTSILSYHLTPSQLNFENTIQSEQVGKHVDFLTKQLVRLREEGRIAAMVKLAERTRRMRESEESGMRQEELIRQRQHDEIVKQLMGVHQESVDTYLERIVEESVLETATMQARQKGQEYFMEMVELRNEKVEEGDEFGMVSDLITSFLIPYVERKVTREMVKSHQLQFLMAAHQSIFQKVPFIERSVMISSQREQRQKEQEARESRESSREGRRVSLGFIPTLLPNELKPKSPGVGIEKSRSIVYAEKFGVAVLPPLPSKDMLPSNNVVPSKDEIPSNDVLSSKHELSSKDTTLELTLPTSNLDSPFNPTSTSK